LPWGKGEDILKNMNLKSISTYRGRLEFSYKAIGEDAVTFLDVGNLGDGESTNLQIKEYVELKGGTYFGLDSNEELTKKLGLPNQIVGDIHETEFESNKFDIVYLGEVIEHTWTPGDMITECFRILKPGGKIVLDTPNIYKITSIIRYLFNRKDSMADNRHLTYEEAKDAFLHLKEAGHELHQPQHKIFFTPAMMKQMLETHGFVVESTGFTIKPRSLVHKFLLMLFPHGGSHLCVVARKATVNEAFSDVA